MASRKYPSVVFGAVITLAIVAAGGLTALKLDSNAHHTASVQSVKQSVLSYHGKTGTTALALLQRSYKVQTKTYSGLGEEVTSINGLVADSHHYWAFYVNGKLAQVGASSYTTNSRDTITWKLESL